MENQVDQTEDINIGEETEEGQENVEPSLNMDDATLLTQADGELTQDTSPEERDQADSAITAEIANTDGHVEEDEGDHTLSDHENTEAPGGKSKPPSHDRPFTPRLFKRHTLSLSESSGVQFKKTFYVPKFHALQMSCYFRSLLRNIFRRKLLRTVNRIMSARQERQPYKIVLNSNGDKIVKWDRTNIESLKLGSQKNITVLDVADALREGHLVKDYSKNITIPLGTYNKARPSQLTQKELKSNNVQRSRVFMDPEDKTLKIGK